MQDNSALGRALAMVRDLRDRCPWDRVQTRTTLRPYLLEETLELDHALGDGDPAAIRDELGDLLLNLAFQLVIAQERGEFTPDDVATALEAKMVRRHPHLFGLGEREPWERLKKKERSGGVLDGLAPTLPPLLLAYRMGQRAASVGFDWPDALGPMAKIREELTEVQGELERRPADPTGVDAEGNVPDALTDEIGDLLFAVVNLARKARVQPTVALDRANRKFKRRFEEVERIAAERGLDLATAGLEVLDGIWEETKKSES